MKNFCEQLAMDFLLGQDGLLYFIEMHQGPGAFASRGDVPERIYQDRMRYNALHEEQFYNKTPRKKRYEFPLKEIADNKFLTYEMFKGMQPESFCLDRLSPDSVDNLMLWVKRTDSKFFIAKPPNCGSGVGIQCFPKDAILSGGLNLLSNEHPRYIFQKYIPSTLSERGCVQCARQLVTISYVFGSLSFILSVPYMREAKEPLGKAPLRAAMVANITDGGNYLECSYQDRQFVYHAAKHVAFDSMRIVTEENLPLSYTQIKVEQK